jgi:hypothetical protein
VIVREIWQSTDPAVGDRSMISPAAALKGPGETSVQTEKAPARGGGLRERHATERRTYQWSRRLPGRRPDSAAGPPA